MSLSPSVLDAMLAAGCTAEQIVAAVKAANDDDVLLVQLQREAEEAQLKRKREADAARKRRQREVVTLGHAESRGQVVTALDEADAPPPSPDKKYPQTPKELTPSAPASPTRGAFDRFWALFPNKVGKGDASKAFDKAIQRIDLETMLAALERYVRKTDDRPWCNPATWLNQDRWTDQPAAQPRGSPTARSGGIGGVFNAMAEQFENGQADSDRSYGSSGAAVLSLPHRRAS